MKYGQIIVDQQHCIGCGTPVEAGKRCHDCENLKSARGPGVGAMHHPGLSG